MDFTGAHLTFGNVSHPTQDHLSSGTILSPSPGMDSLWQWSVWRGEFPRLCLHHRVSDGADSDLLD